MIWFWAVCKSIFLLWKSLLKGSVRANASAKHMRVMMKEASMMARWRIWALETLSCLFHRETRRRALQILSKAERNCKILSCLSIHPVSHKLICFWPTVFLKAIFLFDELLKNEIIDIMVSMQQVTWITFEDFEIERLKAWFWQGQWTHSHIL